ncbi:MAG TPA: phosphotransferase, partial [Candidatus Saccharimonadia bacterium]|nr:phosphotransferase [Candidatus Saccharimonadia bacterium]
GDSQPDHVICGRTKVNGIVDFGDAGVGDPAWDIAVITLYSGSKLPALLKGYSPITRYARSHQGLPRALSSDPTNR